MTEAQDTIMRLVSGGILDRFPKVQTAFIESGASWLDGLAERMDEVYEAHYFYVRPKLSMKPSEFISRQVKVAFQYDRGCVMSRSVTGHQAYMFASDYPHMEGTFPQTRKVVDELFVDVDIPENEKADILGGTAARLFNFPAAPAAALAA
jgi:predicted TIM-barrel fold metal-dependent hydrolase